MPLLLLLELLTDIFEGIALIEQTILLVLVSSSLALSDILLRLPLHLLRHRGRLLSTQLTFNVVHVLSPRVQVAPTSCRRKGRRGQPFCSLSKALSADEVHLFV